MGVIDELLANNGNFASQVEETHLPVEPSRHLAIVTCMDSRLDVFAALGLGDGEAHVLRNAGGVITDDVIRSLALSQRKLGTREVMLIHHDDCGLQKITESGFREELQEASGVTPSFAIETFTEWLLTRVGTPREEALLANRMVEAAETDSSLLSVTELAADLHLSARTLQRLAAKYVGVSPAALIRRRRLQEAAEQIRQDPGVDLTALAHQFGYSDHAHLTNDFRSTLGFTPTAYRRALPTG